MGDRACNIFLLNTNGIQKLPVVPHRCERVCHYSPARRHCWNPNPWKRGVATAVQPRDRHVGRAWEVSFACRDGRSVGASVPAQEASVSDRSADKRHVTLCPVECGPQHSLDCLPQHLRRGRGQHRWGAEYAGRRDGARGRQPSRRQLHLQWCTAIMHGCRG